MTILLPETNLGVARNIAEEIRRLIEAESFLLEDGKRIDITVSIGVSTYGEIAKDASSVVANADSDLYEAKESGRNRVCLAKQV